MKVRVADYMAEHLERLGVGAVFLLSGGGMMHLLDAISRRPGVRYVCNHHEQASAIAAESHARCTGKLGVCYATSGPGGTNTITGVVGAWQDSSPVLFVSGQSKLSQTIQGSRLQGLRQFGTFEVDIIPMVRSVTKYAHFLDDPKTVRYHLEKACHLAVSGRPGPVFLDVPVDVQGALVEPSELSGFTPEPTEPAASELSLVDGALERLRLAKRPLLLAGHGVRVSGSAERFARIAGELGIPIATTQLACDLLEYDHPLYVGHPGMKGDRAGNLAVQTADVILTLGSSLHVLTTGYELDQFAPRAHKIQVELDEHVLARERVGVQEKIRLGVQAFLDRVDERLAGRGRLVAPGAWHERCARWKTELAVRHEPHKRTGDRINYYDLNEALSDLCTPSDTIVTDAGSAFYVIGQAFRVKRGQRVIISGALGSMGFAVPATTGACFADLGRRVICVTGDGSLQTNIHELATIRHHDLDAKVFIVNNDGYVSIRNTQRSFFAGHLAGTSRESGVSFPDLEGIARAYRLPYLSARSVGELRAVVERTLATKGPVICEVFTPADQEIIPMVSSVRREDGSMQSKPLHDMYPFMAPDVLERYIGGDEAPGEP